jgi:hypothetical protein
VSAHRRLLLLLLVIPLVATACVEDEPGGPLPIGKPPPEPAPPPRAAARDPLAKLPEPRYLDQDPPACCPKLLGGWQAPYTSAPGEEVRGTLSSPGPGPGPQRIEVDADVVFRISRVSATGERPRTLRERRVHVEAVRAFHRPYLTLRLPEEPDAYYALELELHAKGHPAERYVSYTYVPPRQSGVALLLDRETAEPGETLRLTVENRGRAPLEYGVAYRLERWEGRWRWLNRDDAFIAIAKGVQPGHREPEQIHLPDDLDPGSFRIVKSFLARASGRELDAAVQFEVR